AMDLLTFSPPSIGRTDSCPLLFISRIGASTSGVLMVTPAAEMKCLRAPFSLPDFSNSVTGSCGSTIWDVAIQVVPSHHHCPSPRIGPLRPQYAQEMLRPVQPIPSVRAVRPGAHLPCRSGVFERRAR